MSKSVAPLSSKQTLELIRQRIFNKEPIIRLENSVKDWIQERSSFTNIMSRYKNYDRYLQDASWPEHLAMSTEFIDIWENIMRTSVLGCLHRVADQAMQIETAVRFYLECQKTIYLAAVFHEIGHRVGPFRISPRRDPLLKITDFQLDVLGELSSDCLLVLHLNEFPELGLFVILQRIFWFCRRGFRNNPTSAMINYDNDAWMGSYLWGQLIRHRVLEFDGQLKYRPEKVAPCFQETHQQLQELALDIYLKTSADHQQQVVIQWMQSHVPHDGKRFLLPSALQRVFLRCLDVPEVPLFIPPVQSNEIRIEYAP